MKTITIFFTLLVARLAFGQASFSNGQVPGAVVTNKNSYPVTFGTNNTFTISPGLTALFASSSQFDSDTNLSAIDFRSSQVTNASRSFLGNVKDTIIGLGNPTVDDNTGLAIDYARGAYETSDGYPFLTNQMFDNDHCYFPYVIGSNISSNSQNSFTYVYNSDIETSAGQGWPMVYCWGSYIYNSYDQFNGYINTSSNSTDRSGITLWEEGGTLVNDPEDFFGIINRISITNVDASVILNVLNNDFATDGQDYYFITILNPGPSGSIYLAGGNDNGITLLGQLNGQNTFVGCPDLVVGTGANFDETNLNQYSFVQGDSTSIDGALLLEPTGNGGWQLAIDKVNATSQYVTNFTAGVDGSITFAGNVTNELGVADSTGSLGSPGQLLTSTGTATHWTPTRYYDFIQTPNFSYNGTNVLFGGGGITGTNYSGFSHDHSGFYQYVTNLYAGVYSIMSVINMSVSGITTISTGFISTNGVAVSSPVIYEPGVINKPTQMTLVWTGYLVANTAITVSVTNPDAEDSAILKIEQP